MFGTRAESVSNFLHKGSKVAIDGKLRYSSWERDGQKRSKLEVVVDDLELLTPRNSQQGGGYQGGNAGAYQSAPAAAPAIDTTSSVYDDDIPF